MSAYRIAITSLCLLFIVVASAAAQLTEVGSSKYDSPTGERDSQSPLQQRPVDSSPIKKTGPVTQPMAPSSITPSTVVLVSPGSHHKIRPTSKQEDNTETYQWKLQTSYKPKPTGALKHIDEQPKYDSQRRIRLNNVTYTVCFFQGEQCIADSEESQIFGPWTDNFDGDEPWGQTDDGRLEIPFSKEITLSSDWQGKTFKWAVRACATYVDSLVDQGAPGRVISPPCSWSPHHKISWLLAPPTSLGNEIDSSYQDAYGDTWNLVFNWGHVKGAAEYYICMHTDEAAVTEDCSQDYVPPPKEEHETSPPGRVTGNPPPNTGNKGDEFWWRVRACAGKKLEADAHERCTASETIKAQWPE